MIADCKAKQITLGLGTVEVADIHFEGCHGVLLRPSPYVPVGEPGRLQNEEYMPGDNDVVLWVDNLDGAPYGYTPVPEDWKLDPYTEYWLPPNVKLL